MPPLFSYKTFSRGSTDALMICLLQICPIWEKGRAKNKGSGSPPVSHEGAEARDSPADDQILHLARAFVGIERFGVRKEAREIVVRNDTVSTQQLAPPRDGLARLCGAECLGERCMMVAKLAFIIHLRQANHEALAGRQVGKHLGEKILHHLKR